MRPRNQQEAVMAYVERFPDTFKDVRGPLKEQAQAFNQAIDAMGKCDLWLRGDGVDPGIRGVIMTGPAGCGKTALACLLAKFGATIGLIPDFISCRRIGMSLKGSPSDREIHAQDIADRAEASHLVVIDDVGMEKGTRDAEHVVHYLLGELPEARIFTIITSNLVTDAGGQGYDLMDHLGDERLWSRMHLYTHVNMSPETAPDYRGGA